MLLESIRKESVSKTEIDDVTGIIEISPAQAYTDIDKEFIDRREPKSTAMDQSFQKTSTCGDQSYSRLRQEKRIKNNEPINTWADRSPEMSTGIPLEKSLRTNSLQRLRDALLL